MAAPNGAALGRRIRSLRIEKGLTLKQIEARVGISATHVSEVERGRTSPTVGALARIAEALGVRPSHLIDFPVGKPQTISRRGSRLQLAAPDGRASSDVLIPADPEAEVSMFLVTLAPGFTEGAGRRPQFGDPPPGLSRVVLERLELVHHQERRAGGQLVTDAGRQLLGRGGLAPVAEQRRGRLAETLDERPGLLTVHPHHRRAAGPHAVRDSGGQRRLPHPALAGQHQRAVAHLVERGTTKVPSDLKDRWAKKHGGKIKR